MKLIHTGSGLGKLVLSPAGGIAMLVLLATAATLAAPPPKTHAPKAEPSASASVVLDEDVESPDVEESDEPKADRSPGACNGNAPQVIADLVENCPTKHDKGDAAKDVPPGLQKVADRLLECQPPAEDTEDTDDNASIDDDPDATPAPIVVDDEDTKTKVGKKVGQGSND